MSRPRLRSAFRLPALSLVFGLLLGLAASGCDGGLLLPSATTTRDLAEARARWRAQRIIDYEYTLQRLCFCGEVRPMRVTVRNGQVQLVTPVGELLPLPAAEAEWYPTIEGLFDVVEAAIGIPAASLAAEYDSRRGFPHSVSIDYWINVADDEITYLVSDIRVQ